MVRTGGREPRGRGFSSIYLAVPLSRNDHRKVVHKLVSFYEVIRLIKPRNVIEIRT